MLKKCMSKTSNPRIPRMYLNENLNSSFLIFFSIYLSLFNKLYLFYLIKRRISVWDYFELDAPLVILIGYFWDCRNKNWLICWDLQLWKRLLFSFIIRFWLLIIIFLFRNLLSAVQFLSFVCQMIVVFCQSTTVFFLIILIFYHVTIVFFLFTIIFFFVFIIGSQVTLIFLFVLHIFAQLIFISC